MTGRRLDGHGLNRGIASTILFDGEPVPAFAGETVAGALLAAGRATFRTTPRRHDPRSFYCGIGVCHDCLVVVDGRPNLRACMVAVAPGMRVESQVGHAAPPARTSGSV